MRGRIDLGDHKLAGLYRTSARPVAHSHMQKRPDDAYEQIWRIVDGAVRDAFANHPEYLQPRKRRNAIDSVVKRVVGSLHGYATQVARGRSETRGSFPCGDAANRDCARTSAPSKWQTIVLRWLTSGLLAFRQARGGIQIVPPKIPRGGDHG